MSRDSSSRLPSRNVVIVSIVSAVLGFMASILTGVGPAIIENNREIDIAKRETHIAETLAVAAITQEQQTAIVATLTSLPPEAQRTEITSRETRVAATVAAIQTIQTEQAVLSGTLTSSPRQSPAPVVTQAPGLLRQLPCQHKPLCPFQKHPIIKHGVLTALFDNLIYPTPIYL